MMSTFIPLFPPFLAIVLAISTRKAYIAIFSGILVGSIILAPSLISALHSLLSSLLLTLTSTATMQCLIFIVMIGAIINLLQNTGAIRQTLYLISTKKGLIKNRYHAQLFTILAGLLMCLEGIGSMMMVGVVGRPLFKQYDLSAEKLAFVANGTGAPITWLLPFSSAGLFLTSLVHVQIEQGIITGSAIDYVLQALPFQFYTLLILCSVLLLAWLPHDFKAESKPKVETPPEEKQNYNDAPSLWISMAPLYLLIVSFIILATLMGDMSKAISLSGGISLIGSLGLLRLTVIPFKDSVMWAIQGAMHILPAVCILILAFTFSRVIGSLGTGEVLAQLVSGNVSHTLLPAMIFLTGMLISFATGSSGATVSILLPIAIPMAASMAFSLPIVIGAVISGAVFGDQSSPISDSVIVASSAAACSPENHFRTQFPIVMKVALLALLAYLILGLIMY